MKGSTKKSYTRPNLAQDVALYHFNNVLRKHKLLLRIKQVFFVIFFVILLCISVIMLLFYTGHLKRDFWVDWFGLTRPEATTKEATKEATEAATKEATEAATDSQSINYGLWIYLVFLGISVLSIVPLLFFDYSDDWSLLIYLVKKKYYGETADVELLKYKWPFAPLSASNSVHKFTVYKLNNPWINVLFGIASVGLSVTSIINFVVTGSTLFVHIQMIISVFIGIVTYLDLVRQTKLSITLHRIRDSLVSRDGGMNIRLEPGVLKKFISGVDMSLIGDSDDTPYNNSQKVVFKRQLYRSFQKLGLAIDSPKWEEVETVLKTLFEIRENYLSVVKAFENTGYSKKVSVTFVNTMIENSTLFKLFPQSVRGNVLQHLLSDSWKLDELENFLKDLPLIHTLNSWELRRWLDGQPMNMFSKETRERLEVYGSITAYDHDLHKPGVRVLQHIKNNFRRHRLAAHLVGYSQAVRAIDKEVPGFAKFMKEYKDGVDANLHSGIEQFEEALNNKYTKDEIEVIMREINSKLYDAERENYGYDGTWPLRTFLIVHKTRDMKKDGFRFLS